MRPEVGSVSLGVRDASWDSMSHSSSCSPNRVILVPPELPVARALLVFRECLVNVVQLVFQVLRVTE